MQARRWVLGLAALALAGCTGDAQPTALSTQPPVTPSRPAGFDMSPNHFTRVLMCGDGMAPRPGTVSGHEPCEQFTDPAVVQPLERELLRSQPAPDDAGCVAASGRLVLTLSDGEGVGLRPPSVEVFADCGLARRPGSDSYFALTGEAERLLLQMAAGTA